MEIYLLRHATRNFTMGDVPLNEEGLRQAKSIAENSKFSKITHIISSPKRRAQMTVELLALKLGITIQIAEELDQMSSHETESQFKSRVSQYLKKLITPDLENSIVLLCSHSDWLSAAAEIVPTDGLDMNYKMFQCAEAISFKIEDEFWKVTAEQILS